MNRDEGFTIIEIMVVLIIVAVLVGIAVPIFLGFRGRARAVQVREDLVVAAKVESAMAVEGNGFSDDAAGLELVEPSLDFDGATDEAIHVVVEDAVIVGDNGELLLYARARGGGDWYGLRLVSAGSDQGRHTCEGSAESDVDTMAACSGSAW